jgi:hypothetical protein
METMAVISIAKQFSPYPFGRYRRDGDHSGEAFREDVLLPVLRKSDRVIVDLDGVKGGLGSSFLEEVFGGLVREHGFSVEELERRLEIVCHENPRLKERSWTYIREAASGR